MSEIVSDKKVVTEGRKDTLKGVDAPLRDQIVQKLYDQLVDEKIAAKVTAAWLRGNANRQIWLERQQAYLASWDEHLIPDTEGPFKGSSNLHIPITYIVVKTLVARFVQALLSQDPPFDCKARNEASMERVPTVADTMRYAILDWANYNKGVESVVDKWVWDWASTGLGNMKLRWDCKYEKFIDVTTVQRQGIPTIKTVNGKETSVPTFKDEEEEIEVVKKVFEGPVLENIHHEDLLILGGQGDPDLADIAIHRSFLTASEIWTAVDRKIFNEEAATKVIEHGQNYQTSDATGAVKQQRAFNAGKSATDNEEDLDRYEILEAYLPYDVDGSGINTEIVVWVHKQSMQLLRATYLRRVSKTGERPFITAFYQLRGDQEFPVGIVELMYPLSREMDAIHNMRLDFGLVSVMPFGFYRATSGIDPEVIQLEPGALIPVDNPQTDVFFPNLGNRTVFGMQEEQAIQSMIERLTSVNDMNLGMISGQGATRTATGARALVGEASSNLDVHLRRLNRGWKKFLRYMFHTLQQRIPKGLSFRLTGDDGKDYWRTVRDADDIAGDFDFEVSPTSETSNKQVQAQTAQNVLQLIENPMFFQTGISTPANLYEAARFMLQSWGVKDFARFITKPQGYQYIPSPQAEADEVLRGMDVPVVPGMDHEGFLAYFQHIHDTDELMGQFSKEQVILLAKQAKKHELMLNALKQAQAQRANVQQMQMNQRASQPPGPPTMQAPPSGQPNGQ